VTIRPGQDVRISGDPGLAAGPTWGSGGFIVAQMGSLSITHFTLEKTLNPDHPRYTVTVNGGSALLKSSTLAGTLHSSGGQTTFVSCRFVGAHLQLEGHNAAVLISDSLWNGDASHSSPSAQHMIDNNGGHLTLLRSEFVPDAQWRTWQQELIAADGWTGSNGGAKGVTAVDSRAGSGSVLIDSCTFYGFLYKARAVQTTACMDQRESSVIRSVQHARLEVLNATFAENMVYEYSDQDPSYTAVICNPASVVTCTNALVSWELPNSCSGTTDASMDHIHEGADCRYSNGAALSFICDSEIASAWRDHYVETHGRRI
jgi:hypothetical protein